MMKADATEQPGIAKYEGTFRLLENKVVVFFWSEAW